MIERSLLRKLAGVALASLLILGVTTLASAQGRGRGSGGGRSAGPPSGPPPGVGTASQRSGGRSDEGRARAGERGNGLPTSNELNRFRGIARKLNTTPQALETQFLKARAANPRLTFGQFVAANVVAHNLGERHPNITTAAILAGLQSGKSLGQTLQSLGLSKGEAKSAIHQANDEIKRG